MPACKCCIDRILPEELYTPHRTVRREGVVRAIAPIGKTWMNGTTLRVRFQGGTKNQKEIARAQAGWWSEVTNLKFAFDDAPAAEIRIAFDENDGAWSFVGTDCRSIPNNQPTMNLGFLDGGTAAHEFGHAIGLAHEHQNPAGGIQWNEDAVIRDLSGPPNNWDAQTIRHNVLRKYSADQINGTTFDAKSIMLYAFPANWTLNGISTPSNDVLSDLDKTFVVGTKMYPKTAPTTAEAVPLTVNARKRTAARIGKEGEEDIFVFTATRDGIYIIDTAGPTDTVMKLFGPNSETNLVAEDDDSGLENNARIARGLIAGKYFVQIRHYNRKKGMGDYSIKVRRN